MYRQPVELGQWWRDVVRFAQWMWMLGMFVYTVDFVLRDPRESVKQPVLPALPVHREEIAILPKPWHRSFVQACITARNTLHVTNPCMQQLLQLWFTSFRCVMCVVQLAVCFWSSLIAFVCVVVKHIINFLLSCSARQWSDEASYRFYQCPCMSTRKNEKPLIWNWCKFNWYYDEPQK